MSELIPREMTSRSHAISILAVVLMCLTTSVVSAQSTPPQPAPKKFVFSRLVILDKPNAGYTEAARVNRTEGVVRLLVVFRATGEIGDVTVLSGLPHGLTERAVAAAKRMRFTPKTIDGSPLDEVTTVEYNFRLYYENDDDDIRTKVVILSQPKLSIGREDLPKASNSRMVVKVFFSSRGSASVFEMPPGLSPALKTKVEEAVRRIKFRPAVLSNGSKMSVTKEVIYDF